MSKKIISLVIVVVMLMSCLVSCTQGLTEDQLADMGYVLNPAENGWVKDPANNGWVSNPADNGWVNDPANNGWVKDPADNGWVKDPAGNGWVKDPAGNGWVQDPANNGWISAEGYIPAPTLEGKVYHWVPGAQSASVTYVLDLFGQEEFYVLLEGKLLEEYVDFTYDSSSKTLEILGTTLYDLQLDLGEHYGYVFCAGYYVSFKIEVISSANAEGSSIPMKEISDINLSALETIAITEPIEGLADLFITEVSTDMGYYNYIEVFNNTNAPYNLKDHRIVFANLTQQGVSGATNGVFDKPLGGASAAYIYQDFEIPALSSAIIWIVNTSPWEVGTDRKVTEAASVQSLLLGDGEENLNVEKFKAVYGLDESAIVFPVRTNYMIGRTDWGDMSKGWGGVMSKSASNRWSDINSSVADRGVQIQKMDETKVFETADGEYYIIEMDVLHREEDIYADGKLDENDVLLTNPDAAISTNNREFIHAVFARRVYVTSPTDLTPTGKTLTTADGYDLYNMNTDNYYSLFTSGFVTPVATALIYPDLAMNDAGEEAAAKWRLSYNNFALQYQAPAKGEHLSKFVPLEGDREKYMALYADNALVLSGIASEYAGYGANSTVLVPVSSAYPTDYIAQNHNSAGRVTALMLIPELVPGEE